MGTPWPQNLIIILFIFWPIRVYFLNWENFLTVSTLSKVPNLEKTSINLSKYAFSPISSRARGRPCPGGRSSARSSARSCSSCGRSTTENADDPERTEKANSRNGRKRQSPTTSLLRKIPCLRRQRSSNQVLYLTLHNVTCRSNVYKRHQHHYSVLSAALIFFRLRDLW